MQSLLALVLLGSFAAGQTINCNSFGIPDDYQGHKGWRASTKDCAAATNNLESKFGQSVPEPIQGCTSIATSGECEISMCDSTNARADIDYAAVWAAARVIHARHKADGNVAGYISLDDYSDPGHFKTFVKVAKKGSPDPSNKRKRELPGQTDYPNILDEREEVTVADHSSLKKRTNNLVSNFTDTQIQGTHGLYTNIQAGWGPNEPQPDVQLQNAMENLLWDWNSAQGNPSTLRAPAYMAPGENLIEFEWAAHNNHNIDDIRADERSPILYAAIRFRQAMTGHPGNFAMQVRRGGETIGHLIIRVFWAGLDAALADVCA